jgi:hypothetical protein
VEISPSVAAANDQAAMRAEVLRRMEVYVLELLFSLLQRGGSAADKSTGSPRRRTKWQKSESSAATAGNDTSQPAVNAAPTDLLSPLLLLLRDNRLKAPSRTLQTARQHLLLLRVLYSNVERGTIQTHRDVYYHLVREVPSQVMVNRTVQQLARVLRVPRQLMGVTAGGRGYIAGSIRYRGTSLESLALAREGMPLPLLEADLTVTCVSDNDEERCGAGSEVREEKEGDNVAPEQDSSVLCIDTPGCMTSTERSSSAAVSARTQDASSASEEEPVDCAAAGPAGFQVLSNVRYIIVVEKHAVFAHLLRGGLLRLVHCVLLTAQGYPTHAAHRLLANLHAAVPRAAVVGLVDYNPHGLAILAAYRWPSSVVRRTPTPASSTADSAACQAKEVLVSKSGSMPENRFCAVPALRWLGVRASHVRRVEGSCTEQRASCGREPGSARHGGPPQAAMRTATDECERAAVTYSNYMRMRCSTHAELHTGVTKVTFDAATRHLSNTLPNSTPLKRVGGESTTAQTDCGAPCTTTFGCTTQMRLRRIQPPMYPFSQRDTAVLDNLIQQLEARVRSVATHATPQDSRALTRRVGATLRHDMDYSTMRAGSAAVYAGSSQSRDDVCSEAERASTAAWLREATAMRAGMAKCELEMLYTHPYCTLFGGAAFSACEGRRCVSPSGRAHVSDDAAAASSFARWVAQELLRGRFI